MGLFEWFEIERLKSSNATLLAKSRAQRRLHTTQSERMRELEAELGRVSLLAFALAELCLEKGVVTEAELEAKFNAIDAEDGAEDEKLAKGRALPGRKSRRA